MKKIINLVTKYNFKMLCAFFIVLIFASLLYGCFNDIITSDRDDDLVATIVSNKKYYKVGEQVELSLILRNRAKKTMELMFNDGQTYDFVVKAVPDEKEVWRWSEGMFFTQAIWTMILDPWERKTYLYNWDQKDNESKQIAPGNYKIEAVISSEPEIFANPINIIIEEPKASISFDTIDKGTQSGYHERSSFIIKDQARWEEIWNLHTSNLDQVPRIPKVDFDTDMVIAVFRGEFPSSGFDTKVTGITEKGGKIEVTVTETDNIGGMVLDVITYPFHIIKTKKSALPVEFNYREVIK